MKQLVTKLGHGMARLAFWRKRASAQAEPATVADVPPASPNPPATPAVAAPVTPPEAFVVEELVELGDPASTPVASADKPVPESMADHLAELGDLSTPFQGETISEEVLYTDNTTGGLAELDFIPEPDVPPPPVAAQSPKPQQAKAVATDVAQPEASAAQHASSPEDVPEKGADSAPAGIGLFRRILSLLGNACAWIPRVGKANSEASPGQQASPSSVPGTMPEEAADAAPAGIGRFRRILGLLGSKRVWIPGVGIALLAVIGSLTFMLVKTSSEKAHLQADLSAAQKALKKSGAVQTSLAVAVVPPLLAGPVPPVEAHSQSVDASTFLTRTSGDGEPVQMDCELSDKASVAQNLKKCIEAFNQATGH